MSAPPSYTREDEARAAAELAALRGGGSHSQSLFAAPPPPPPPPTTSMSSTNSGSSSSKAANKQHKSASPTKATDPSSSISPKDREREKSATDESEAKSKKRRRVVVACDTCRRKKVKCQGLPNPTNTCNNCSAYNYRCTFTSEPDRSRGKYEILESKVETLLSALRSVAPHIATQFERGELNITGPSGGSAPPQNATGWSSITTASGHSQLEYDQLQDPAEDIDADEHVSSKQSGNDVSAGNQDATKGSNDTNDLERNGKNGVKRESERDMLLPDIEDGRPRYFGRSSTMTLLHSMHGGKDSRPPSPGPHSKSNSAIGDSWEINNRRQSASARPSSGTASGGGATSGGTNGTVASGPSTGPNLQNTNSKEWIQLLRRKNTVAVGRDDLCTEEWFYRYTLPAKDLVADLLDLFFEHLSPLMPIVHRPSLERDIAAGRGDKDWAFRGFVFTILAIASRFSKDPRVYADASDPDTAGDHFAAASRLYHQVYAASLINVQVMILTATFMHGSIGPGASWTVLGVAIRALQDMGLHQERAYKDLSPFDQEIRRRVFWGAFILDCIFTINMGRPAALRLSDCDVKLPLEVDDDTLFNAEGGGPIMAKPVTKPIVMSGFIHMIKLNVLVQDVVHTLYGPRWRSEHGFSKSHAQGQASSTGSAGGTGASIASGAGRMRQSPEYKDMAILSKRLDEWVAETPAHLRSLDSPFKLQAGIVQCGTHDIRLYILKPFLNHAALRKMLHPQCSYHARECLKVVIELYEGDDVTDLVFIFQQAFMSTATFMITVWHECRDAEKLAEDNDLIEATLRMFASFDDRYFSRIFRRAHRILRDIAVRTIHTMTSDQRERVSTLLQSFGLRLPAMMVSPALLGSNQRGTSGTLTNPIPFSPSLSSAGGQHYTTATEARANGGGAAKMPGLGAMTGSSPMATSNMAQSWSLWGPNSASSPGRPGMSDSIPDASKPWASASAQGDGDSRGFVNFLPSVTEEPGASTIHYQLDDLLWTDYFAKFLDDIGPMGQTPTGTSEMQFAVGSPSAMATSSSGGTTLRQGGG